jgi:DNA-binding response OmpR family regulator
MARGRDRQFKFGERTAHVIHHEPRAEQNQILKGATVGVALRGHPFPGVMLEFVDGRPRRTATRLVLTRTEFRILSHLVRNINSIVPSADLWEHVRGASKPLKPKTIHVFLSRVRGKTDPFGLRIDSVVDVCYILSHGACCSKLRVKDL